MKKKLIIILFATISIFSLVGVISHNYYFKGKNKEKNDKVTEEVKEKEKKIIDTDKLVEGEVDKEEEAQSEANNPKQEVRTQSSQANNSVTQNDTSISERASNNTITSNTKVENENSNAVSQTDLYYSIHKGRKSCNEYSDCQNSAIDFFLKYKKVTEEYAIYDVTSNAGNTLYYFIAYRFKEGSYDDEGSCNSIGNEIKNVASGVTSFSCINKDNKFYLNIFTDY